MTRLRPISPRRFGLGLLLASLLSLLANPTAASSAAVGLADASQSNLTVPRWLYLATDGATVGASALLASLVTDRRFVERVRLWQTGPDTSVPDGFLRAPRIADGALSPAVLALTVSLGYTGPQASTVNFAVIIVFAGLRAGYTMFSYLVADTWRVLSPWWTLVLAVPNGFISYLERFSRWSAVAGIFALVWVEATTAITTRPSVLATALIAYSVVTLAGAVVVGADVWFDKIDLVSVFLQFYGRVTPVRLDGDGLSFRLPGI